MRRLARAACVISILLGAAGCATTDAVNDVREGSEQLGKLADAGQYMAQLAAPMTTYSEATQQVDLQGNPAPGRAAALSTAAADFAAVQKDLAGIKPEQRYQAAHRQLVAAVARVAAATRALAAAARASNRQAWARASSQYTTAQTAVGNAMGAIGRSTGLEPPEVETAP